MTAAAVQGFWAKLAIGAASPVDKPLDFTGGDLALAEEIKDRAGMRGTREHPVEVLRTGLRRVEGSLTLQPTAVEWSNLLAWILGGTPSGTSYPLAETVAAKYVTIDKSDGTEGKVFEYSGCKINRATFRGQQGEPLELTLDILGIDETVTNAGTFPSLTLDTTTAPFAFFDCALTIGGTTYNTRDFELSIDNRLDGERFFNSQVRTGIFAQDREITCTLNLPYGEAEAVYNSGPAGVAVVATFTNDTVSLTLSMAKLVFGRRSPVLNGKAEIMLPVQGIAHKSGSTASLVVTLDSTP